MPVNITNEELDLFNKNGFSDDDVRETINSYRSQGLDDKAIRNKIDQRLNSWQPKQETPVLQGGVSEWFNPQALDEKFKKANQKALEARQEWEEKHPIISGIQKDYQSGYRAAVPKWEQGAKYGMNAPLKEQAKTGLKQFGLNLVPATNMTVDALTGGSGAVAKQGAKQAIIQGIKTGTKTGAIGGVTQGLTSSLADNGISKDLLTRPLMYGGAGLLMGAPLGAAGGLLTNYVGRVAEKTANKPVQQTVAKTTVNTPQKPTRITKKSLETEAKQIKNDIKDLQVEVQNPEYITRTKQGRYWKVNIDDDLTKGIREAETELNDIIKEIQNNPQIANDSAKIAELESRLGGKLGIDNEFDTDIYSKFYEAINKADDYNNKLLQAGEMKQRGLPQSVISAKGTPQEVKKILKNDFPEYQVMHNNELTNQAVQEVETDFNNELSRLTGAKEFDALDYEKSRQIAKKLFDAGRHEEAVNLIDNVSENATKKGQAIQALSLWSNMTPEGAVYKAEKLIKAYNQKVPAQKKLKLTPEQIDNIRMLQNEALNATDDLTRSQGIARTAKYVTELIPKNVGQKLKAYRNISLLLNPKTLGRNIIGNTLFNAVDTASKAAAVPIDRIIGRFTGNKTRVAPQLGEFVKGGLKGAKTGFQEALEGIDTRGLGKRFDLQEGRTFKNPVMRNLETALDVGLRVPDRTQYEATFAESVANMMKAQGVTEPTQEILEQAEQEALESVFQNQSAISDLTTKVRKSMNTLGTKDFGLGDLAIPYAQTPANLVQQAINYSPAGLIKGINNLSKGNQRQASLDIARALMGTGIIGSSYGLSQNGNITPSQFDENYQKNKLIKANLATMGIKPETINGMWYAPFQPMSTSIAIGNAMANGENPAQAGLNTMLDLPFLQNVNRGLADIKDKGIAEAGINFAGSLPAQFVPTVASQMGQTIDPYQRETYDANKLRQGINQAIAKVPGLSQTLPEKIDVTGRPIERYESKGAKRLFDIFLNPTYVTQRKDDVTLSELKRLYDKTGETKQFLPVVDKKISYKNLKGEDVKITLDGKQFSNYQKQVGTINKQILDNLVQTGFYQNLDDEEKIQLINSVTRNVKSSIDNKLFNKPDAAKRNLIKRLTETEKDKVINDVLKTYKNDILPSQINNIYKQIFE